ncbi:hypothetical protein ES703_10930 [subsurface metagenome]
METVRVYEKDIVNANILRVAAGTTGLKGGDSGHGGRTYIEIEDKGNTDIKFKVINDGTGCFGSFLRIELGGDAELETIIEGLEFIVETLKANKNSEEKK